MDLLADSYVSTVEGITLTGASPDFTREQFLAHAQSRINTALNDYAVDITTDAIDGASALGVSNQLFARAVGRQHAQTAGWKHLERSRHQSHQL